MGCRGQEDTKLIILLLLPTFCKGVGAAKEDAGEAPLLLLLLRRRQLGCSAGFVIHLGRQWRRVAKGIGFADRLSG